MNDEARHDAGGGGSASDGGALMIFRVHAKTAGLARWLSEVHFHCFLRDTSNPISSLSDYPPQQLMAIRASCIVPVCYRSIPTLAPLNV